MTTKSVFAAQVFALFAALSLLGVPQSNATSVNMTPVVATLSVPSRSYEGVDSIALLADGRLQMIKNKKLVDTVIVPAKARSILLDAARGLADVELDEQNFAAVCMAMFSPELSELAVSGFDTETGTFNSKMRTVLTSENCDMSRIVRPVANGYWKLSMELRAQLKFVFLMTKPNSVSGSGLPERNP